MDGTRFDEIAQRLATAATRRRIVGSVLGGAALLTGAALARFDDADAKKGKGKAKGKGKGKGKGRTKVFICHKGDDGTYKLIRVGAPAVKGHSKHGDTVCEAGVCQTGNPTGCAEDGACTFANAEDNTACTTDEIAAGHCEAGVCVEGAPD